MGSYDGAEACILLHSITEKYKNTFGLFWDDRLGVLKDTACDTDIKNGLRKWFQEHNLRITAKVNKKTTDFLDVTFDLNDY